MNQYPLAFDVLSLSTKLNGIWQLYTKFSQWILAKSAYPIIKTSRDSWTCYTLKYRWTARGEIRLYLLAGICWNLFRSLEIVQNLLESVWICGNSILSYCSAAHFITCTYRHMIRILVYNIIYTIELLFFFSLCTVPLLVESLVRTPPVGPCYLNGVLLCSDKEFFSMPLL